MLSRVLQIENRDSLVGKMFNGEENRTEQEAPVGVAFCHSKFCSVKRGCGCVMSIRSKSWCTDYFFPWAAVMKFEDHSRKRSPDYRWAEQIQEASDRVSLLRRVRCEQTGWNAQSSANGDPGSVGRHGGTD